MPFENCRKLYNYEKMNSSKANLIIIFWMLSAIKWEPHLVEITTALLFGFQEMADQRPNFHRLFPLIWMGKMCGSLAVGRSSRESQNRNVVGILTRWDFRFIANTTEKLIIRLAFEGIIFS